MIADLGLSVGGGDIEERGKGGSGTGKANKGAHEILFRSALAPGPRVVPARDPWSCSGGSAVREPRLTLETFTAAGDASPIQWSDVSE